MILQPDRLFAHVRGACLPSAVPAGPAMDRPERKTARSRTPFSQLLHFFESEQKMDTHDSVYISDGGK